MGKLPVKERTTVYLSKWLHKYLTGNYDSMSRVIERSVIKQLDISVPEEFKGFYKTELNKKD